MEKNYFHAKFREIINTKLEKSLDSFSKSYQFTKNLNKTNVPSILSNFWESINYSAVGGKRLRGILIMETVKTLNEEFSNIIHNPEADFDSDFFQLVTDAAVAIECIHAFSLVHDDLPCMDDDDLRRGRPSCHIKYGEPMALLVGDALQTIAMQVLTSSKKFLFKRFLLIKKLSWATGPNGMTGGQVVDIAVVGKKITLAELKLMHSMKTGALLESAVMMGLVISEEEKLKNNFKNNLIDFAKLIGIAFQVTDDILDAIGDEERIGKKTGRDNDLQKPNFVQLMGLENARQYANELIEKALSEIYVFDSKADGLRTIAKEIVVRSN